MLDVGAYHSQLNSAIGIVVAQILFVETLLTHLALVHITVRVVTFILPFTFNLRLQVFFSLPIRKTCSLIGLTRNVLGRATSHCFLNGLRFALVFNRNLIGKMTNFTGITAPNILIIQIIIIDDSHL